MIAKNESLREDDRVEFDWAEGQSVATGSVLVIHPDGTVDVMLDEGCCSTVYAHHLRRMQQ